MSAAKKTRKARAAKRSAKRHARWVASAIGSVEPISTLAYQLLQGFLTQRTRPAPPEAVGSAVLRLPEAKMREARAVHRLRIQNLLLSLPQGPEPQNEAPHG